MFDAKWDQWLADQLDAVGLVTKEQVRQAAGGDGDLGFNLVSTGVLPELELLKFLGGHFQTRYITTEKLSQANIRQWVLEMLPVELCQKLTILPVRCDQQRQMLSIVSPNPADDQMLETIRRAARVNEVQAYVGLGPAIEAALRKWHHGEIHAFDAVTRQVSGGKYRQMLDVYDQRLIDLKQKEPSGEDAAPLELDIPQGSVPEPTAQPTAPASARAPTGETRRPSRQTDGGETVSHLVFAETVAALVNLDESRQDRLRGHSLHVARLTQLLGERLSLGGEELAWLRIASLLHDVGKEASPHLTQISIARSTDLRDLAKSCYSTPVQLLEAANLPARVTEAIGALYEQPSGAGVPGVAAGESVPLYARLIAAADAFVDLTEAGADRNTAMNRLRDAAAKRIFDPEIVDLLFQVTSGPAEALSQRKVLIVDADAAAAHVLERRLLACGYQVRVSHTTTDAARELLGGNYDLILSEVQLSPVDGFDFLERIRADERTARVPLIYVTECSEPDQLNRGFELGAFDYIVKPYPLNVLQSKVIQALTDGPQSQQSAATPAPSGDSQPTAAPEDPDDQVVIKAPPPPADSYADSLADAGSDTSDTPDTSQGPIKLGRVITLAKVAPADAKK